MDSVSYNACWMVVAYHARSRIGQKKENGNDKARCCPGAYRKESLRFFRACVGDDVYSKAMNSEAGKAHHYAVARAFLDQPDWEKFVWIEEHGSLDSFPG